MVCEPGQPFQSLVFSSTRQAYDGKTKTPMQFKIDLSYAWPNSIKSLILKSKTADKQKTKERQDN
jgi:hypothetical protein